MRADKAASLHSQNSRSVCLTRENQTEMMEVPLAHHPCQKGEAPAGFPGPTGNVVQPQGTSALTSFPGPWGNLEASSAGQPCMPSPLSSPRLPASDPGAVRKKPAKRACQEPQGQAQRVYLFPLTHPLQTSNVYLKMFAADTLTSQMKSGKL